jgi:hypothetical protein
MYELRDRIDDVGRFRFDSTEAGIRPHDRNQHAETVEASSGHRAPTPVSPDVKVLL